MLYAYGDDKNPLDETVRCLDEIVTDFIIETCHTAAFMFAIRKDEVATGRVRELHTVEKKLKEARKQFDTGEGKVGLERGGRKKKDVKEDEIKADVKTKVKEELVDEDEDLGDIDDE